MGVIQKQGIKSSIFIVLGFVIGAINTLLIAPALFSQEQIGMTKALVDVSSTLMALSAFGSTAIIYKFQPFYSDYLGVKKNDLPLLTLLIITIGYILVCITCFFYKDFIIRKLGKAEEFKPYFFLCLPFTFFLLVYTWLEVFVWFLQKTVLTNFLRETYIRLLVSCLLCGIYFKWFDFDTYLLIFSLQYAIPATVLLLVLIKSKKWRLNLIPFSSVTKRLKKKIFGFAFFVYGTFFLHILAKTIDIILVLGLKGLKDAGIFTIAMYIVAVLEVPLRSLTISVPVLARAWKDKDMPNINHIYTKSVSNLLVIGIFLMGIIGLNISNLSVFLSEVVAHQKQDYSLIVPIVFILGIARLIDLGTGVNSNIIATSNFWKFDFYSNMLFTIIAIPANYFLVKYFGLVGLALSNLIALFIFNFLRYVFLWKKFNLQPYTKTHLTALLLFLVSFLLVYILPIMYNIYVDTILRTILFIILFTAVLLKTRVSIDIIQMLSKQLIKFKLIKNPL